MKKVIITDCAYESVAAEQRILAEAGAQVLRFQCKTEEEVIARGADCDVLMVQFAPVTRRVIETLDHCQLIVRYAVGVDNIDLAAAAQRGIPVCNVPDYGVDEVSTHAAALILACSRKLPLVAEAAQEGNWSYLTAKPLRRFAGSRLGLIGFGRIPALVAKKLSGFGLQIGAYDPFINHELARSLQVEPMGLDELLSTSDYISVHCPLNETTRGLLDRRAFSLMKEGAALINTARGGVLCEEALVEALDSRKLSFAALDVLAEEPMAPGHPLRGRSNVLITPHIAWYSEEAITALQEKAAQEAARVLRGEPPLHPVNLPLIQI